MSIQIAFDISKNFSRPYGNQMCEVFALAESVALSCPTLWRNHLVRILTMPYVAALIDLSPEKMADFLVYHETELGEHLCEFMTEQDYWREQGIQSLKQLLDDIISVRDCA